MRASALRYCARGQRVLPIQPREKAPAGHLAPRGVHDASGDPRVVRDWWARVPDANIAIAVPPEWFVVDIDPRNGGDAELERLQHRHGRLPDTITAQTGSGGTHLLFSRPTGLQLRGKLGQGIDLLGVGRYFLVAPSIHPSGGVYRWTSTKGAQIAPPPAWLTSLARAPVEAHVPRPPEVGCSSSRIDRARKYLERVPPAISGSGGHAHTFAVAQKLVRGFALDEGTAFAILSDWNRTCEPPWSARELARKINQAVNLGRMPVGALIDVRRT